MTVTQLAVQAALIRIQIIKMVTHAQSGHVGGALGLADIYTALYFGVLRYRAADPTWSERDYVLVSNGHTCPVWYSTLAVAGFFPKTWLSRFRELDSPLQGHPRFNLSERIPGVENTSGPLGQGLSQACGLALALKRAGKTNHVFCFLSDAEHQEGQIWEAYLFAHQHQLNNLTAIIDFNQIQISGTTDQVMSLDPLPAKLASFGWLVKEVDGHAVSELVAQLIPNSTQSPGPRAIIAKTISGKGVSFMEHDFHWHGKAPNREEAVRAIAELQSTLESYDF
jgi:transketolase